MPPRALLAAMQDASDDIKVVHSSLAKANRAGGSAEAVRNRAAGLGVAEKLGLQYSNVIAVVNHLRWAGPPPKSNESIRERFKYNTAAYIWFQATMQVLGARAEREFVCGPLPKDLNRRRIRKRSRRPAVRVEVAQPTDDAPPGGRLPSDSAILLEEISPPGNGDAPGGRGADRDENDDSDGRNSCAAPSTSLTEHGDGGAPSESATAHVTADDDTSSSGAESTASSTDLTLMQDVFHGIEKVIGVGCTTESDKRSSLQAYDPGNGFLAAFESWREKPAGKQLGFVPRRGRCCRTAIAVIMAERRIFRVNGISIGPFIEDTAGADPSHIGAARRIQLAALSGLEKNTDKYNTDLRRGAEPNGWGRFQRDFNDDTAFWGPENLMVLNDATGLPLVMHAFDAETGSFAERVRLAGHGALANAEPIHIAHDGALHFWPLVAAGNEEHSGNAKVSPTKRSADRKNANTERMRKKRQAERAEGGAKVAKARAKGKEQKKLKRLERTPEQKEADKRTDREQRRSARDQRTPEQKQADKRTNREQRRSARDQRTPAKKQANDSENNERERKSRKSTASAPARSRQAQQKKKSRAATNSPEKRQRDAQRKRDERARPDPPRHITTATQSRSRRRSVNSAESARVEPPPSTFIENFGEQFEARDKLALEEAIDTCTGAAAAKAAEAASRKMQQFAPMVCLVCDELHTPLLPRAQLNWVDLCTPADMSLLGKLRCSDSLGLPEQLRAMRVIPDAHASFHDLMLSPRAQVGLPPHATATICDRCHNSLRAGRMPKFAIRNGLHCGVAANIDALKDLTLQEPILLRLHRTRQYFKHEFAVRNPDISFGPVPDKEPLSGRVVLSGHYFSYEGAPAEVAKVLKNSRRRIHKVWLCTGRLNKNPTDIETAKKKATAQLMIREEMVRRAMEWLCVHNVAHDGQRSALEASIQSVVESCDDDGVPEGALIETTTDDAGGDVGNTEMAQAGPTGKSKNSVGEQGRASVLIDLNLVKDAAELAGSETGVGPTDPFQSAAEIAHISGSRFYPSWDPAKMAGMYYTIWPFGRGGETEQREVPIGAVEFTAHMLRLSVRAAGQDSDYILERFDTALRKRGHSSINAKLRFNRELVGEITEVTETSARAAIEHQDARFKAMRANRAPPPQPLNMTRGANRLMQALASAKKSVHGTMEHAIAQRNKFWAMTRRFGLASIWGTTPPKDTSTIEIARVSARGLTGRLPHDECSGANDASVKELVARDAGACAMYHKLLLECLYEHVFGLDPKNGRKTSEPGIFGHMACLFGATEEQLRLALHAHLIAVLRAGLPKTPKQLFAWLSKPQNGFAELLLRFIDAIQKAVHPAGPAPFAAGAGACPTGQCPGAGFANLDMPGWAKHAKKPLPKSQMLPSAMQCRKCGFSHPPSDVILRWALANCGDEARAAHAAGDERLDGVAFDFNDLLEPDGCGLQGKAIATIMALNYIDHNPRHHASCFKKGQFCRYGMPAECSPVVSLLIDDVAVETTWVPGDPPHRKFEIMYSYTEPESGARPEAIGAPLLKLVIKRLPGYEYTSNHNYLKLMAFRCDVNTACVAGAPNQVFYITTYASKLPDASKMVLKFMAAFQQAVEVEQSAGANSTARGNAGRRLFKMFHATTTTVEHPVTMAAHMLLNGMEDKTYSHQFSHIHLNNFIKHLKGDEYVEAVRIVGNGPASQAADAASVDDETLAAMADDASVDSGGSDITNDDEPSDSETRAGPSKTVIPAMTVFNYTLRSERLKDTTLYDFACFYRVERGALDEETTTKYRFRDKHPLAGETYVQQYTKTAFPDGKVPVIYAERIPCNSCMEESGDKSKREDYCMRALLLYYPWPESETLKIRNSDPWEAAYYYNTRVNVTSKDDKKDVDVEPADGHADQNGVLHGTYRGMPVHWSVNGTVLDNIVLDKDDRMILKANKRVRHMLQRLELEQNYYDMIAMARRQRADRQASVTGHYHEDDDAELGELRDFGIDGIEYDENEDDDDSVIIGDPADPAGGINMAKTPKLKATISRFTTIGCSSSTAPSGAGPGSPCAVDVNPEAWRRDGVITPANAGHDPTCNAAVTATQRNEIEASVAHITNALSQRPSLRFDKSASEAQRRQMIGQRPSLDDLQKVYKLGTGQRNFVSTACVILLRGVAEMCDSSQVPPEAQAALGSCSGAVPGHVIGFLGGNAGAGKSRAINAVKAFASAWSIEFMLRVTAPTGAAACLVGGMTIHSLVGLMKKTIQTDASLAPLAGVKLIIIDEVSMISLSKLGKIEENVRLLSGCTTESQLFGGVNMLLCGDFNQLPPAQERDALYTASRVGDKNRKLKRREWQGAGIWSNQLTHVFFLRNNYRSARDKDYAKFLENLRVGTLTKAHLKKLKARMIGPSNKPPPSAVYAFPNNEEVNAMNQFMCFESAAAFDPPRPVYRFPAVINPGPGATHVDETTTHGAMHCIGLAHNKSKADVPLSYLDLCIGAPVQVVPPWPKPNQCNYLGVANGSLGVVVGFHPAPPAQPGTTNVTIVGNQTRKVSRHPSATEILVHIPGSTIKFDGLAEGVVPIPVATTREMVPGYRGTVKVAQFPLRLALARTGHKLQGRTEEDLVIGALSKACINWIYVAMSRVSGWANLYLLPGIVITTKKVVENQSTEDMILLKQDRERLENLAKITSRSWAQHHRARR